ncbi:MAG: hypothetical protein V2I66_07110 [Halieaceae bacterium]|nr:hypothetical protein [Halieaceae bacterium]
MRFKGFGTINDLPGSDIQGEATGSPALDGNLDLRLLWRKQLGNWEAIVDHSSIALAGDAFEFSENNRGAIDQTPTDDDFRALELTWTLERDDRYRVYHRFDRLALRYSAERWNLTFGREAVSWGSGKVFNPLDLFAPFAPTTVDRDYKPGQDLVKFDRRLAQGDLQLLGVLRRDGDGGRDHDENSYGGRWHRFLGNSEIDLALVRHFGDDIGAISFRQPLGGALLQTDWMVTRLDEENDTVWSGVVNLDYSFSLFERTTYLFAEYFRNGFGRNNKPVDLARLPPALVERLQRGELFTLMKDYAAVGGSYQWHPLLMQNLTWLANLQDGSGLLQTNIAYEPGDHQRLEAGLTLTHGERGEEYGRIDVGDGFTTGGGSRIFLRWTYFW